MERRLWVLVPLSVLSVLIMAANIYLVRLSSLDFERILIILRSLNRLSPWVLPSDIYPPLGLRQTM